jgi:hypothetical protein
MVYLVVRRAYGQARINFAYAQVLAAFSSHDHAKKFAWDQEKFLDVYYDVEEIPLR